MGSSSSTTEKPKNNECNNLFFQEHNINFRSELFSDEAVDKLRKDALDIRFTDSFDVVSYQGHGALESDTFVQVPEKTIVFLFQNPGKYLYSSDVKNRQVSRENIFTNFVFFLINYLTQLKKEKKARGQHVTMKDIKENIGMLRAKISCYKSVFECPYSSCSLQTQTHFEPYFEHEILPDISLQVRNLNDAFDFGGIRSWEDYLIRGKVSKGEYTRTWIKSLLHILSLGAVNSFHLGQFLNNYYLSFSGIRIFVISACMGQKSPYDLLQVQPNVKFLFRDTFNKYKSLLLEKQPDFIEGFSSPKQVSSGKNAEDSGLSYLAIKENIASVADKLLSLLSQLKQDEKPRRNKKLLKKLHVFSKIFYSSFVLGSHADLYSMSFMQLRNRMCPKNFAFALNYVDFEHRKPLLKDIFKNPIPIRDGFGKKIDWGYTNFTIKYPKKPRVPRKLNVSDNTSSPVSGLENFYYMDQSSPQGRFFSIVLHQNKGNYDLSQVFPDINLIVDKGNRREIFNRWKDLMHDSYIDTENSAATVKWDTYSRFQYILFVEGLSLDFAFHSLSEQEKEYGTLLYQALSATKLFFRQHILGSPDFFLIMMRKDKDYEFRDYLEDAEVFKFYHRNMSFPFLSPIEFMLANYIIINDKPLPLGQVVLQILKDRTNLAPTKDSPKWVANNELHTFLPADVEGDTLKDRIDQYIGDHKNAKSTLYFELVKRLPLNYLVRHLPILSADYLGTYLLETFFTHLEVVQFSQKYCVFDYILVMELGPFISELTTFIKSLGNKAQVYQCRDLFSVYLFGSFLDSHGNWFRKYKHVASFDLKYLLCMEKALLDLKKSSEAPSLKKALH